MSKFFIKTLETTSIIVGDKMTLERDYLYVHLGDELVGMYKADAIVDAHKTESK